MGGKARNVCSATDIRKRREDRERGRAEREVSLLRKEASDEECSVKLAEVGPAG